MNQFGIQTHELEASVLREAQTLVRDVLRHNRVADIPGGQSLNTEIKWMSTPQ